MPTIALIGHVSSGKSSTVGHLVKACGVMDPETLADCERDALELGSSGNKFSWIVDSLQAEREGGTSIEAHEQFIRTGNGGMTLIDTPGCPFYMKAITNSASQADIAVLVVSAGEGEFEAGMAKDGGGTTVSSVMIAHSLGVKNLVIVVNKVCDDMHFLSCDFLHTPTPSTHTPTHDRWKQRGFRRRGSRKSRKHWRLSSKK
jgi:elongation factor 1-alpha